MSLPDRVAFTIPGINIDIYWYAIMITIGMIAAVIVTGINAKRRRMISDTAIDLCLWTVPIGVIFARIYYIIFNPYYYQSFLDMINFRNGGLAIPGGIIGGALGIVIYSLIKKKKVWGYLDIAAPAVALAQAIGRWGNFFNQEAYGPAVMNSKLLFFPLTVRIEDCSSTGCTIAEQHGHLATFFYEFVLCLAIFAVLMIIFNKVKHSGDVFILYVLSYTFERAIIEQLRTDSLMLGNIKITQLLYVIIFVLALAFVIVRAIIEKKKNVVWCKLDLNEYYEPADEEDNKTEEAAENDSVNESDEAVQDEVIADDSEENEMQSTQNSDEVISQSADKEDLCNSSTDCENQNELTDDNSNA